MGVHAWSRTFAGKEQVRNKLFGGVDETLRTSSGGVSGRIHQMLADGDHVVVEHTGASQAADGRSYRNDYCWIFSFRDGLVHEVREYMDPQLVTETFAVDPS